MPSYKVGRLPDEVARRKKAEELLKTPHLCSMCGKRYSSQVPAFFVSNSDMYKGNGGYFTVCNKCLAKILSDYENETVNTEEALNRFCQRFDLPCDIVVWNEIATSKMSAKDKVVAYIRRVNTYEEDYYSFLEKHSAKKALSERDMSSASEEAQKWGAGYTEDEYIALEAHYKELKAKAGNDYVKDVLIRDLCEQMIMKNRALQSGDVDTYSKLSKLYQETLKSADLKPASASDNEEERCWGDFLAFIEQYAPAEYPGNKKPMFEEKDYYDRHIKRPTDNLLNGTVIQDDEYKV